MVGFEVMTLDLSRWQFGITSVFHFIFVPLSIGLALLMAMMQTAAYRTRHDPERHAKWERMTVFWRRLFLINFAIGVVTGIVQEFQFGMNWSLYSRYVGSVFGLRSPLKACWRSSSSPRSSGSGSSGETGSRHACTWPRSGS